MSVDDPFVQYYADESLKPTTLERFQATKDAVLRAARVFGLPERKWIVADIGCGAATQCGIWARDGHRVFGTDINEKLIELGRTRMQAANLDVTLTTGSATKLPWGDESMDICLCPELLEHVADWQPVVNEATRVLKPGGLLYLSTTNKLCPVQEEFDLVGYSWYPAPLKRRYERLAVTTRPQLVNYAKYPAVNWFSYYGLRKHLSTHLGLRCLDRFDVAKAGSHGAVGKSVLNLITNVSGLRFLGHCLTPYTMVFAQKPMRSAQQSQAA